MKAAVSNLTIHYLPLRARAEPIRMVLAFGKIPFADNVIPMEEWPQHKQNRSIFRFGQVPAITLPTGESLSQSGAILRYAAKLVNIYPEDPVEALRADMIQELAMEMNPINPIMNWFEYDSESYHAAYKTYFAAFPARMETVVEMLGDNKYLGGNTKPHHGDFALFHILETTEIVNPSALSPYPTLQRWMEDMKNIPELREYLNNRPKPPAVGREGSFLRVRCA